MFRQIEKSFLVDLLCYFELPTGGSSVVWIRNVNHPTDRLCGSCALSTQNLWPYRDLPTKWRYVAWLLVDLLPMGLTGVRVCVAWVAQAVEQWVTDVEQTAVSLTHPLRHRLFTPE